jgi:hypothetical protein
MKDSFFNLIVEFIEYSGSTPNSLSQKDLAEFKEELIERLVSQMEELDLQTADIRELLILKRNLESWSK